MAGDNLNTPASSAMQKYVTGYDRNPGKLRKGQFPSVDISVVKIKGQKFVKQKDTFKGSEFQR